MLYKAKVKGKGKPHNYPKMQITHMLIVEYWKKIDHCSYKMMMNNMGIFNEEACEISFSILGRCVLGDSRKDDFEHMNKIYSLLPLFRDIRNDVFDDHGTPTSLSWRHQLNAEGLEVQTGTVFFNRAIRQILRGTFRSYDGTAASFKNAVSGSAKSGQYPTEVVHLSKVDMQEHLKESFDLIESSMDSHFLAKCPEIWPEAISKNVIEAGDIEFKKAASSEDSDDDDEDDVYVSDMSNESKNDVPDEQDDPDNEGEGDQVDEDDFHADESPFCSRSWEAWGRINPENQMYGNRARKKAKQFLPSNRRVEYK
jgi:hypothetical protein